MNTPEDLQAYIEEVTLEDGRKVLLRPIRPEDAPLLQEGFLRLSAETIYMRFLGSSRSLGDREARDLATVDYHDRMALVGEVHEAGQPKLVVVARYSIIPDLHPVTAEIAVVVRDDYQSHGLGKRSMALLIRYARDHQVAVFIGTIHSNNQRVTSFVRHSRLAFKRQMLEPGVWEYRIFLDRPVETEAESPEDPPRK